MIAALTILLAYQLVGEILAKLIGLPIPGPVLGMTLLFLTLLVRGGPGDSLKSLSNSLLQHLSLLFIPAGTGILLHLHRLADDWLPLLLSVFFSTLLAMAITALLVQWLDRRPVEGSAHHE